MFRRSHRFLLIALVVALASSSGRPLWAQAARHEDAATGHAATAAPAVAGEHADAGEPSLLKGEPTLAVWTLVVFVSLLLLLKKYAWKPLLEALQRREGHLERALQDTERARNESEALLADHRRQMARAADEVRALLEKARQDAQAASDQIVRQAQQEAESARQRAQRDIAAARDQALGEIWEKSADLAVSVAGRVLGQQLSGDDHRRLLDAAIRELPAGANGHGGHAT